jgi:Flp pilus assembly protein TadG
MIAMGILRRLSVRGRRFVRHDRGATAVEFGLIALPFFFLIVAIIETGLAYFADSTLDNATNIAARMIRTGQAQQQGFDVTAFKTQICNSASPLLDCSKLSLDVRTSATFSSANLGAPLKPDGTLDTTGFSYNAGHGTDIVVVRAFYPWPTITNLVGTATTGHATFMLAAVAAFRNEPFNW